MAAVQEVSFQTTEPIAMPLGVLTPLPWPDWSARLRSLDVDGVHVDYIHIGPYQMDIPPLADRPELPVRMMLVIVLEGTSVGDIDGHTLSLSPKQAAIIDGRAAMRFHAPEPVRALRMFVNEDHLPDTALSSPSLPIARLRHTPLETGCIGLLTGLLQVGSPVIEPHDEEAVGAPLVALLASLLDQTLLCEDLDGLDSPSNSSRISGRRRQIQAHIDRFLTDRDLSVATIAVALGVHVRTVHTAYQGTGTTVSADIRARRLARAQVLLTGRSEPPNVAAIAKRVGLTRDQLTRTFQAATGQNVKQWWSHHRSARANAS